MFTKKVCARKVCFLVKILVYTLVMEFQTEHVKVAVDVMMHEILVLKMLGLELLVLYGVLYTYKME